MDVRRTALDTRNPIRLPTVHDLANALERPTHKTHPTTATNKIFQSGRSKTNITKWSDCPNTLCASYFLCSQSNNADGYIKCYCNKNILYKKQSMKVYKGFIPGYILIHKLMLLYRRYFFLTRQRHDHSLFSQDTRHKMT